MKRAIAGTLLLLILVGEPTVGIATGLYTLPGFIVLGTLYVLIYLLYEALDDKYQLSNLQLLLINFGLYAVLITGLLHGEIADFVLHPNNNLITVLIRIQSACFPLFVYPILNRYLPRTKPPLELWKVVLLWLGYFLLLTPTKKIGFLTVLFTLKVAPMYSIVLIVMALMALLWAIGIQKTAKSSTIRNKTLLIASVLLAIVGAIPNLKLLFVLLIAMPLVTIYFISQKNFRTAHI